MMDMLTVPIEINLFVNRDQKQNNLANWHCC